MSLRIRRGTDGQRQAVTFDNGELVYVTDTHQLFIGDGVTSGGVDLAAIGIAAHVGVGLNWNELTHKLDITGSGMSTSNITEGTNLYFTADRAQDAAASLLAHTDGHSNISFVYDDSSGKIYATVTVPSAGIASVGADTAPRLGGNLNMYTHSIFGVGSIAFTGILAATSIGSSSDDSLLLTSDLNLDNQTIVGSGNINIAGDVVASRFSGDIVSHNGRLAYSHLEDVILNYNSDTVARYFSIATNSTVATTKYLSSNGTIDSPDMSVPGDVIGALEFHGHNDLAYGRSVMLTASVDQAVPDSAGVPGAFTISTVASNGLTSNYFRFDSYGVFSAPIISPGIFTTSQRDSMLNAGVGMIIYNSTDSKFQGYQATGGVNFEWVNLS
jgi:hypothetical protein